MSTVALRRRRAGRGAAREPSPTPQGYRSLWLAAAAARRASACSRPLARSPRAAARPLPRIAARAYAACVAAPFRVGQELELTVDSLAAGGRGVARHDGVVVFVDRALPGDRVMARIQRVKRRHGEAIAFERLVGRARPRRGALPALRHLRRLPLAGPALRAPARAQAAAGAATRCSASPGCPIRRSSRSCRPCASTPTATSSSTPGRRTPEGVALGFHRAGPLGGDRPARGLPAHGRRAATPCARRSSTGRAPRASRPTTSATSTGYLRHLVVREGVRTGEVLCILVTSRGRRARRRASSRRCSPSAAPGVVGVLHAVNDGVAEVDQRHPDAARCFGRAWFEEEISGLRLRVSAGSFLQTNTEMADVLYQRRDRAGRADRRRDRVGPVLRARARSASRWRAPRAA